MKGERVVWWSGSRQDGEITRGKDAKSFQQQPRIDRASSAKLYFLATSDCSPPAFPLRLNITAK